MRSSVQEWNASAQVHQVCLISFFPISISEPGVEPEENDKLLFAKI